METKIIDLTTDEQDQIKANISAGIKICKTIMVSDSEIIKAQDLDICFQKWAEQPSKFTNEEIANGLGALFGEILATDFKLNWKMVEDEIGKETALLDEESGSIIFPINTVWKRIEPSINPEVFFGPMWNAIKSHLSKEKES
jgi:hypothetical protein